MCELDLIQEELTEPGDVLRSADQMLQREMSVAKTENRAIIGTLVEFARMLELYTGEDRSLRTLAIDLAETPCSILGDSPRRATMSLMAKAYVS